MQSVAIAVATSSSAVPLCALEIVHAPAALCGHCHHQLDRLPPLSILALAATETRGNQQPAAGETTVWNASRVPAVPLDVGTSLHT